MYTNMKSLAIIPAYNEDINVLKGVAKETKKHVDGVLVIDDGSKQKVKLNVKVLRNEPNMGKGKSLLRGFDYALKNKYDVAITLDADGEHKAHQIPEFLNKIKKYDYVVGQRMSYRTLERRFINSFATFWFTLLIPGIKDMYCGFRAIKLSAFKKMEFKGARFELEPEMLLECIKNNISIGYQEVETDPLAKTNFKFSDYLRTNELYDKWVLKNHRCIKANFIKKTFLIVSALIGLILTKVLKWVLRKS